MPLKGKLNAASVTVLLLSTLMAAMAVRHLTGSPRLAEVKRTTPVLGTFATYIVIAEEDRTSTILNSMDSLAGYLDNELGTFGGGELFRINDEGSASLEDMSPDIRFLLKRSLLIAQITDSLFDPAMGVLVSTWGFPHHPRVPDSGSVDSALALSGLSNVHYTEDSLVLSDGTLLDMGAIAKGYVADRVFEIAMDKGAGAALVEIGGEIRCGGSEAERTWRLAVRDPREDSILEVLELENGAVATSGDYESRFFQQGRRYCHILDPRDGYPETGVASVTVVSDNATDCDALATAIAVGGTETAEAIPDSLFSIILVLTEDSTGEITEWRREAE